MLFTDSDIVTESVLTQLEPRAAKVIDLLKGTEIEGGGSIAEASWSEARGKLESALATFSVYYGTPGSQAHNAAVLYTGYGYYGGGARARIRLNQIVVHDIYYSASLSPVQRWLAYTALKQLYQAVAQQVVENKKGQADLYESRREFYEQRQDQTWRQVVSQGLPAVQAYLDAPASKHGYQAGTFDATNISLTPQTGTSAQNVNVAITYVDGSRYVNPLNKNNAESGPGPIVQVPLIAGNVLNVNIGTLNPPNSLQPPPFGISQPVAPMLNASHWNLYVGNSDTNGPLYLQNASPIPIRTQSIVLAGAPLLSGYQLGQGQVADMNCVFGNLITRG